MFLPVSFREPVFSTPEGSLRWVSSGPLYAVGIAPHLLGRGARLNPYSTYPPGLLSARLFVGLSVGPTPTYSMDAVVSAVEELWPADASFLLQAGFYTYADGPLKGTRIREGSVQVVMLNLAQEAEKEFHDKVIGLAVELCGRFQQERVVVEFQKDGVVQESGAATTRPIEEYRSTKAGPKKSRKSRKSRRKR